MIVLAYPMVHAVSIFIHIQNPSSIAYTDIHVVYRIDIDILIDTVEDDGLLPSQT